MLCTVFLNPFVKFVYKNYICIIIIFTAYTLILSNNWRGLCKVEAAPVLWTIVTFLNDAIFSFGVIMVLCGYVYVSNNRYRFMINSSIFILIIITYNTLSYENIHYIYEYNTSLNSTLTNGLVLVHPIFLYLTFSNVISNLPKIDCIYKNCLFFFIFFKKKLLKSTLTSLVALVLGCWWAQQELNWGGWWNWDPIELISYLLFIMLILWTHNYSKWYRSYKNIRLVVYMFSLVAYFLSRHDVLSSIHSFASFKSSIIYEYKYILYFSLILVLVNITFIWNKTRLFYTFLNENFSFVNLNKIILYTTGALIQINIYLYVYDMVYTGIWPSVYTSIYVYILYTCWLFLKFNLIPVGLVYASCISSVLFNLNVYIYVILYLICVSHLMNANRRIFNIHVIILSLIMLIMINSYNYYYLNNLYPHPLRQSYSYRIDYCNSVVSTQTNNIYILSDLYFYNIFTFLKPIFYQNIFYNGSININFFKTMSNFSELQRALSFSLVLILSVTAYLYILVKYQKNESGIV